MKTLWVKELAAAVIVVSTISGAGAQDMKHHHPVTGMGHMSNETTAPVAKPGEGTGLPTQAFRDEHKAVLAHLSHVVEWTEQLKNQQADGQKKTAEKIVKFFRDDIKPHAQWEEKHLYPLIDKLTKSGDHPFTSTMRHEHRIVERWIDELAAEVKKPQPDYDAFTRRSHNLVGLLWAHFEEEEEVLLPYVDKNMTEEEFKAALGKDAAHH